ncbi:hypothetical protein H310_06099 [Aphanomyces invadans]|uniref:CHCH domain-containing protein n=1 Tax=Aphanomyces invadans TaxID=157072 RepID=A0A024U864_9STRA|nr:hypothetical protein H310_06099 [Aphanomyces invadans]ETW02636.1 hypothetical protein H310_06099 [Aphanomyces invadans]|eukprot:XP_008869241.1 hypothetical protein H310_06099 [Aphanomyces invadans]
MARSRSSASSSSRRPVLTAKPAPAPVARTTASAPVPVQTQPGGGLGSGLLGTVAEGMAFGTGSAIAHRAVGAVANSFGGSSDHVAASTPSTNSAEATTTSPTSLAPPEFNSCLNDHKAFLDCLQVSKNDIASCQFYFDQFNMCKSQGNFRAEL